MPRSRFEAEPDVLQLFSGINIDSGTPVYMQIENIVKFGVVSGKLKPNQQLPSIREVAELFELNPNTVAKAVRDLEVLGVVYTRRGMGVFIAKDALKKIKQKCHEQLARKMHEVVQEALACGMNKGAIDTLVNGCVKSNAGPYGQVPSDLLKIR